MTSGTSETSETSEESTGFAWSLRALKALADASRLKILGLLASRECSVEELASLLDLKAPTVSHHLARLRDAGLVGMRSEGNSHLYRLDEAGLGALRKSFGDASRVAGLAGDIERGGWERKVLRSFVDGETLTRIPASRKKREVVLRWLVDFFDRDVVYAEKEINQEIQRHHWDSATLRRELVASGLMAREAGMYWRLPPAD